MSSRCVREVRVPGTEGMTIEVSELSDGASGDIDGYDLWLIRPGIAAECINLGDMLPDPPADEAVLSYYQDWAKA